jgi:hypothetical protein
MFCTNSTQRFIISIFYECEFSGVENHTHIGISKIILLVSRTTPLYFTNFFGLQISNTNSFIGIGHHKTVFVNVYLADFGCVIRPNDCLTSIKKSFNHDLTGADVVEFEFTLILYFFHGGII